jgi:hypothetical protein
MGLEATCVVRVGRQRATAKALLESDHLLLRLPDERLKIFFRDITKVDVKDGRLALDHAGGSATLYLGAGASKWAEKIRNPRSLMDKLGVKQGMRVSVVDVDDAAFLLELDSHMMTSRPRAAGPIDVLFFGTEDVASLVRLAAFKRTLASNGAIWVVHRKGKDATIKDTDVFAAAKQAGLVDNKVVSFSATHTAERLVIPLKDRVPQPPHDG